MKTHIALVGGQPIPVYLGIKYSGKIDRLILICSEQTKHEADRLASYFEGVPYETVVCNPVNLSAIEDCAKNLKDRVFEDEVILNLTSGTKPWTLVFYRYFMALMHVDFILVDQNNRIQNLHTHEEKVETIDHELRFQLYGTPLTHYTRFSDYTEEDFEVCKKVEQVRKSYYNSFKDLTMNEHAVQRQGRSECRDGSYAEWNKDEGWVTLSLYNKKLQTDEVFDFESPHVMNIVFNNGWFELKTAMAFSKNELVQDIWMNCEFAAKGKMPKNEIDMILDMGNKLFFVECKTMVKDVTAIDKFHSAIKNFSGTSSKGIFVVNDSPSVKNTKYATAMEKCSDNGILTFNFSEYKKNNKLPFLNEIVNKDLNKTNTR